MRRQLVQLEGDVRGGRSRCCRCGSAGGNLRARLGAKQLGPGRYGRGPFQQRHWSRLSCEQLLPRAFRQVYTVRPTILQTPPPVAPRQIGVLQAPQTDGVVRGRGWMEKRSREAGGGGLAKRRHLEGSGNSGGAASAPWARLASPPWHSRLRSRAGVRRGAADKTSVSFDLSPLETDAVVDRPETA